jgi:hypothetical protein
MRLSMKAYRSCLALVVLCLLASRSSVCGQGVPLVNFSNNDLLNGINVPFYDVDGITRLEGERYLAQLYYGASDSENLVASTAAPQPFGTGASAGYWRSSQVRLTGVVALQYVRLQVRFWDSENGTIMRYEDAERNGGAIGVSITIIVALDPAPSATPMTGLQSASLVPPIITLTRGTPTFATQLGAASAQLTNLCGVSIGSSRWFRLTSPFAGNALLTTAGSEMDTVMGAFRGSIVSPSALVPITCNDDFPAGAISSQVRFPVDANTLYLVCVAGKNGGTNTVRLSHTLTTELQIRRGELDRIELSWPADATNCLLEAAPGLHGVWRTITNAPVTATNQKVLSLESGGTDETVYRLRLSPAP